MNLWQDLISTALVGTERQTLKTPAIDNPLGKMLHHLDSNDREGSLLGAAAAIAIYQKAGKLSTATALSLPEPCNQQDLPCCNPLAGQHLTMMLSGEYNQVLPEWLTVAAKVGKRIPPQCLPALLTLGKRQNHLQSAILPVLGKRGLWLAGQNPEWSYATSENTESVWKTGNSNALQLALSKLRQQDPKQAREQLQENWQSNNLDENVACLQALETGLSLDDEPFLNSALDHKRKAIRDVAAKLLAQLPESELCERMIQRVLPLIQLQEDMVEVTLPTGCTKDAIRDGIDQSQYSSTFGEKGSLLLQMLACIPPSVWSQHWEKPPAAIISAAEDSEWNKLLIEGWAKAAINSWDVSWAEDLLQVCSTFYYANFQYKQQIISKLLGVLPQHRADAFILKIFTDYEDQAFNSQHPVVRLLSHSSHYWGVELSNLVLSKIQENLQDNHWQNDRQMRSHMENFALYMEPSLAHQAITTLSPLSQGNWQEAIDNFLSTLQFRWEMIQALQ
ncbi:MAG: DUF5691 domain-containing protein [Calothrix sp. MO_192.B10]|nr:DUF5691 domain-containing protein [Calothrix sp. MO_192.B10]